MQSLHYFVLDNLIKVNNKTLVALEIRTGRFSLSTVGESTISFKTPFKNSCITVIAWDSPSTTSVIPVATRVWTNTDFKVTCNERADECCYLALGY